MLPIAKRITRLKELIETLESGGDVSNSDMRLVIYREDLQDLRLNLDEIVLVLPSFPLPSALKKYAALLRKADAIRCRQPAKYPKKGRPGLKGQSSVPRSEDSAYAAALEYLHEYSDEWGIRAWLDRWPNFDDLDKSPEATAEAVPRLINSTSKFALEHSRLNEQRRRLKISILRSNLDSCLSP